MGLRCLLLAVGLKDPDRVPALARGASQLFHFREPLFTCSLFSSRLESVNCSFLRR